MSRNVMRSSTNFTKISTGKTAPTGKLFVLSARNAFVELVLRDNVITVGRTFIMMALH